MTEEKGWLTALRFLRRDMEKGWLTALRFLRPRLCQAGIEIVDDTYQKYQMEVKAPNRRWLRLYIDCDGTMEIHDENIVAEMQALSPPTNAWEVAAIANENRGAEYYAYGNHVALDTSFHTCVGDITKMAEDMHYVAEQMGSGHRRPMCEHCAEELDADGAPCSVCSQYPF